MSLPPDMLPNRKILLVDADTAVTDTYKIFLEQTGFKTETNLYLNFNPGNFLANCFLLNNSSSAQTPFSPLIFLLNHRRL